MRFLFRAGKLYLYTKWEMPGYKKPQVWNQVYPKWIRLVTNLFLEVSQIQNEEVHVQGSEQHSPYDM